MKQATLGLRIKATRARRCMPKHPTVVSEGKLCSGKFEPDCKGPGRFAPSGVKLLTRKSVALVYSFATSSLCAQTFSNAFTYCSISSGASP